MSIVPLRPIRTPLLPREPVPGRYKTAPEDFVVDELPLYPASGEGQHLWVRIEKRGRSTPHVVDALASALGIKSRDVGYAGMKDRHAISRQWLSMPAITAERLQAVELEDVEFLEITRHTNKLKLGHLTGNRFEIVLRPEEGEIFGTAEFEAVRENLVWLAEHGVPNWFGEQRFGSGGRNLDKGLRLLFGGRREARGKPKRLVRLLISAVQSEVFNHVLAERVDDYGEVLNGDVAWIHANRACFLVGESDVAEARERAGRFEISPTGPLPGPDCLAPEGDQLELEQMVLEALELDPALFGKAPGGGNEGARRPLRVALQEPSVEQVAGDLDGALRLRFTLERGAFATSVLRELLDDPPWFELIESAEGESVDGEPVDTAAGDPERDDGDGPSPDLAPDG